MALSDLQGTVITKVVQQALYEASIAQALCGSPIPVGAVVGQGKTIRVAKTAGITARNYDKNTPITVEDISPGFIDLVLDHIKYTAFGLDETEAVLLPVDLMAPFAIEAGRALANAIDADIFDEMIDGAGTTLDPVAFTSTYGPYAYLLDMVVAQDSATGNATPPTGGWYLVGSAMAAQLKLDPRVSKDTVGGDSIVRTGLIGDIEGRNVYKTGRLEAGVALLGNQASTGFVQAVAKTEQFRPLENIVDVIRSYALYGVKVLRPEFLVVGNWTVGS